jgi:hypothetical protein
MAQAESLATTDQVAPPWLAARTDRSVGPDAVARARTRAIELVDRDSASDRFPQRILSSVKHAWRWLAHNIRIALSTEQPVHHPLVPDPVGLRALIQHTRVALVTTRDRSGALHSEPMEASQRDFDGVIWFPASESAPVLERVRARAAVQLTYHDKHSNRCVVLDGIARVCDGTGRHATNRFIRVDVVSADAWD